MTDKDADHMVSVMLAMSNNITLLSGQIALLQREVTGLKIENFMRDNPDTPLKPELLQ